MGRKMYAHHMQAGPRGRPEFFPPPTRRDVSTDYKDLTDGYRKLACAIIYQAALDWRNLIMKKAWLRPEKQDARKNFEELRSFFRGELCEVLVPRGCDLIPERMLAILEAELQAAMRRHIK